MIFFYIPFMTLDKIIRIYSFSFLHLILLLTLKEKKVFYVNGLVDSKIQANGKQHS